MHKPGMVSIWFFIGILLLAYGIVICAAGVHELYSPPAAPRTLGNLHAGIWWGAILFLVGLFYSIHFRPSKTK